jgi:hypothetical protein
MEPKIRDHASMRQLSIFSQLLNTRSELGQETFVIVPSETLALRTLCTAPFILPLSMALSERQKPGLDGLNRGIVFPTLFFCILPIT